MAKKETAETVNLREQNAQERKMFLGKLTDDDFVPGSTVTIREARENQQKAAQEFEASRLARVGRVQEKKAAKELSPREEANLTQTRMVIPGVMVEVEQEPYDRAAGFASSAAAALGNSLPELESDSELLKKDVAELITLAGVRGVEVKANVDDKQTLVAKLNGTFTESEKDDLTGKSRADLEKYATEELGFESVDKTAFPNVEALVSAIRERRKNVEV